MKSAEIVRADFTLRCREERGMEVKMYIHRHAEETIKKLSDMFGAVLVAGPRQVGKTTMLQRITSDMEYVTLDDPIMRQALWIPAQLSLKITRRLCSLMRSRRRRDYSLRLRCRSTGKGRKDSSFFAVLSSFT